MSSDALVFPQVVQLDETPSPTPRATATSVALEIVSANPVGDAVVIQPNEGAVLESGYVTVIFPPISRARTFQASLEESNVNADACYALTLYTAEGEMERDARLIHPARIIATLDSDMIAELGGPAVVLQTYALGGISLQVNDAIRAAWNTLASQFDIADDGSFRLIAKVRAIQPIPYCIRMNADAETLELAFTQINGIPTPTGTPTPTATPTVAPTPTSVPIPALIPSTGDIDMTLLSLLLIAVANVIALSLFITKILARRAGR